MCFHCSRSNLELIGWLVGWFVRLKSGNRVNKQCKHIPNYPIEPIQISLSEHLVLAHSTERSEKALKFILKQLTIN